MIVRRTPGVIKRFRRTPWRFQQTFETPLNDIDAFTSRIVSVDQDFREASITIDQVVFEPRHLQALIAIHSPGVQLTRDFSITVDDRQEIEPLLRATFSDWVDFLFVPVPKSFILFADHDEFVTFYANTKAQLNGIVKLLASHGYRPVQNWKRVF